VALLLGNVRHGASPVGSRAPASRSLRAIVAFWVLTATARVTGTAIVAVRTPEFVALGSDSMLLLGRGGAHRRSMSACKIEQINEVFFSAAGVFAETQGGFNAFELAKRSYVRGADTRVMADRFEKMALRPFSALVDELHRGDPAYFSKYCESKDCLEVAFIGFQKETPMLSVRSLRVRLDGGSIKVTADEPVDCPGSCKSGAQQVILGTNAEATQLFDRTPHFWKIAGVVPGMEELIGTEISAHPDAVAAPVAILMINRSGPVWAPRHQGLCPDAIRH
jgi:hypothetical protein